MASFKSILANSSSCAKKSIVALISLYQYGLSPFLKPSCRFYPSCSTYGVEALKKQNLCYALWLIIKRILRCHPWHSGGVDPVPERKK